MFSIIGFTIQCNHATAVRVKKAGFDAVEVLSGTGYLVSEFLSPLTNKRDDEYGGSVENRMRFGLEILQSIRQAVGDDYPVLVRMDDGLRIFSGGRRAEGVSFGNYFK